MPYDGLVIATGVRPRRLPGGGGHQLRTLDDALALRERLRPGRRLMVVGAGFLGAEAAAVARKLGCDVTLLEPAPVPLVQAVGNEVGQVLADVHRDRGVNLRTGVTVTEVTEGGVRLAGGETVEGDEVLVAVGSSPNTDWLAARTGPLNRLSELVHAGQKRQPLGLGQVRQPLNTRIVREEN
ncbi:hypothetical protein GCM10010521_55480 [Streptomyces rameus]|uniref:FAD/NAD(P)-binding domain-containing protein n=1 Tax=Streptomyces rameus TaxID=68261 RepID=A0ABP6HH52_9ACTN